MQTFEAQALLFDLDGVLVDSTICVEKCWQIWSQQNGLKLNSVLKVAHGRPTIETIQILAPHLVAEIETRNLELRAVSETSGMVEIAGASALLADLLPHQWAVVTSGSQAIATSRMYHIGLPLPNVLITADDIIHGKPHPEGYLQAAKLLNAAPQDCIVLEDTPVGIEAAKAAGMRAIGVTTTYPATELVHADIWIRSLADLQPNKAINGKNMQFLVNNN